MKSHGDITADLAYKITDEWNRRGYDVYYDHGSKHENENVGKIVSWFGETYNREAELSQLDIAVVERTPDKKVIALVEIEETSDRPKTILGDVFGFLFGNHIIFKKEELLVGDFTTLFVVGVSKSDHSERNQYLQSHTTNIKDSLDTHNSKIGKVVVKTFLDEKELIEELPKELKKLLEGK